MVIHRHFQVFIFGISLLLALLSPTAHAAENCQSDNRLTQVINADHRADKHRARDIYRNPEATLKWLGVTASMTVVEIWPGGAGWYSEILAPYLKDCGQFYAAGFDPDSDIPFYRLNAEKLSKKFTASPEHYAEVKTTILQPPAKLEIAPPGTADRVLTFRNVHNWMKGGYADAVFKSMYTALKPGGELGVIEHRATAGTEQDPKALSGYVTEAHVIELAQCAGFELLDRSEINANPKDNTAHEAGVWTLPPSLRLGEKDREKYLAIGESDRMTLKFRKPLKPSNTPC